jgi:membrane-associated phospholipid phosphatase
MALWPVRYVGWIAALLNVAMIAATPVDGSHYFCDVAAGLTIALLSWVIVQRALGAGERMEAGRRLSLRPL